jgi:hypothetical protein
MRWPQAHLIPLGCRHYLRRRGLNSSAPKQHAPDGWLIWVKQHPTLAPQRDRNVQPQCQAQHNVLSPCGCSQSISHGLKDTFPCEWPHGIMIEVEPQGALSVALSTSLATSALAPMRCDLSSSGNLAKFTAILRASSRVRRRQLDDFRSDISQRCTVQCVMATRIDL